MKLRPEQIQRHFQSDNNPRTAYWISGDEVLLRNESTDAVRRGLSQQGFVEREKFVADNHFDWTPILTTLQSPSLFAEKKRLEIDLSFTSINKAATDGIKDILDSLEANPRSCHDNRLIIYSGKLDSRQSQSAWYKKFCTLGAHITVWPITRAQFPQWIAQRMQQGGLRADFSVAQALAEQVEGNLLAAQQEIEKLSLLYGQTALSIDNIAQASSDRAQYSIFDFTDAVLGGNTALSLRSLDRLRESGAEAVLILWALARDVRLLVEGIGVTGRDGQLMQWMKSKRILPNRQPLVKKALERITLPLALDALSLCQQTDASIKGQAPLDPWYCFSLIASALSSGNHSLISQIQGVLNAQPT